MPQRFWTDESFKYGGSYSKLLVEAGPDVNLLLQGRLIQFQHHNFEDMPIIFHLKFHADNLEKENNFFFFFAARKILKVKYFTEIREICI